MKEVERAINKIFEKKAKKLKTGDITPLQQYELDKSIKKIQQIINQWYNQNEKKR